MRRPKLVLSAVVVAFVACTSAGAPGNTHDATQGDSRDIAREPAGAAVGRWGVALEYMDRSVQPGDDFYRYVNGQWLADYTIPDDRTNVGVFGELADRAASDVLAIVEDAADMDAPMGTPEQRIGDLYKSFMNVELVEALGLEPLRDGLDAIAAARTHDDIIRIMALPDLASNAPIGATVDIDLGDTDRYALYLVHAGLGLPDRDYYLEDDMRSMEVRTAYEAHIARMLALADVPDAEDKAAGIIALETALAETHWPIASRRDRDLTYNPMTVDELAGYAPGIDWRLVLDAAGLGDVEEVILREKDAFPALARVFADTPVAVWRDYLTFHMLSKHAEYLPRRFSQESFDFFGRTLRGQPRQRVRWRRALSFVNDSIGFEVGRIYVERHFSPEAKTEMEALVDNLIDAFGARIDKLDWMTEETKAEARAKLAGFRAKIGYPDVWEDYSALEIRADDLVGNVRRFNAWVWFDMIAKLGQPIDRDEWLMSPQTVSAYYSPNRNEIVFPAAILQPPFFDPAADEAVNYGGIGAVIGHEISHGFDDQGRKSDGSGALRDWWSPEDADAFEARASALGAQYADYAVAPGYSVDPILTMGENLGDLGGVTTALEAYRMARDGRPAPVLDGYTGEQRFFLAWAQFWRRKYREEELINLSRTDTHSPSEFRTNGVVRNIDAWYDAFNVRPGNALYLPPEDRVSVW